MAIGAYGNKVMDTRDWHSQQGVPPKYDVDSSVQYGRSMIEMLGVLAIIAVLSVGGIAGYVSNTIINQCLNTANVNNTSMQVKKSYVGGIAGYIDEKSSVSDCYVLGMQDTLKISAQADDKLLKTTVWEENNSVYYSTLQRANQEFQAKLQKAQDDLYNEQSKLSGIENHIRSLKSKIYEYDRQINEISARRSRYKWYQFGKRIACDLEIAGIRVIQAGLWVTVGAEEAARAVAYGAIEAFQWVVNGLVSIGSYLISDVQWIQPYDDCTRTENIKDAYVDIIDDAGYISIHFGKSSSKI